MWLLALALSAPQDGVGSTPVPAYVLAGQSNMEGYAKASQLAPEDLAPDPSVLVWNFCSSAQAWEPLAPGVNTNPQWEAGCAGSGFFGPEVALGKALAANEGEPVYLIKVARAGTWLAPPGADDPCGAPCLNLPPDFSWDPQGGALYARLIAEVQNASAALQPGRTLDVRGIFWTQGVNDAFCTCHADAYAARLAGLRGALRADLVALGVAANDDVPLVVSWTPDKLAYVLGLLLPTGDTIRAAQLEVARGDAHTGLVETSDYTTTSDQVHFDAAGQLRHGDELFAALQSAPLPVPTLTASQSWLKASEGGTQALAFEDPGAAGQHYLVLGSLAGTEGFRFLGVDVPLAPDAYFAWTFLVGAGGVVDAAGQASAQVVAPAAPTLVGLRAHHAFALFGDAGDPTSIVGASSAIGINLIADLPLAPL
ncbi:MAG: sialate O-acetylesterase [Planctomycetota bacterium]